MHVTEVMARLGRGRGASNKERGRLCKLSQTEDVSVWVLKPGDPGTAGRGPNAAVVLPGHAVMLKTDALLRETRDGVVNVRYLPTKYGKQLRRKSLDLSYAQHRAVGIENGRKTVLADQAQAQDAFVKGARLRQVQGRYKRDEFACL